MEFAYLKTIAFTANDLPPQSGTSHPGHHLLSQQSLLATSTGHSLMPSANHAPNGHQSGHHHLNSMSAVLSRQINSQACHELFDHILAQTPAEPSPSALSSSSGFVSLAGSNCMHHDDNQSENGSATTTSSGQNVAGNHPGQPTTGPQSAVHQLLIAGHGSGPGAAGRLMAALDRYTQLMQLLPMLRWFRTDSIVELFFSGLIGNLSFDAVMPFILSMDVPTIFHSAAGSSGVSSSAASDTTSGTAGRDAQQMEVDKQEN
jgi:hypothetical protein